MKSPKFVFSAGNEVGNDDAKRTSSGQSFQIRGPDTQKVRLPTEDSLKVGTTRPMVLEERIGSAHHALARRAVTWTKCPIDSALYFHVGHYIVRCYAEYAKCIAFTPKCFDRLPKSCGSAGTKWVTGCVTQSTKYQTLFGLEPLPRPNPFKLKLCYM